MSDESKPQETTSATARTVVKRHETAPGSHFEVVIEPTVVSRKRGYDLTIRKEAHGWCQSNMTLPQLAIVRNALTEFIEAELGL